MAQPLTPRQIGGSTKDGRAYRSDFAHRHYRIGEETLLDLFAGIAFWFLVGMAPALAILAIMVLAK
jgi:hypothetical protein